MVAVIPMPTSTPIAAYEIASQVARGDQDRASVTRIAAR